MLTPPPQTHPSYSGQTTLARGSTTPQREIRLARPTGAWGHSLWWHVPVRLPGVPWVYSLRDALANWWRAPSDGVRRGSIVSGALLPTGGTHQRDGARRGSIVFGAMCATGGTYQRGSPASRGFTVPGATGGTYKRDGARRGSIVFGAMCRERPAITQDDTGIVGAAAGETMPSPRLVGNGSERMRTATRAKSSLISGPSGVERSLP